MPAVVVLTRISPPTTVTSGVKPTSGALFVTSAVSSIGRIRLVEAVPPRPSLVARVRVAEAGGVSVSARKLTVLVPSVFSSAAIWAAVPVRVTLEVPEPDTAAPLVPAVTVSRP